MRKNQIIEKDCNYKLKLIKKKDKRLGNNLNNKLKESLNWGQGEDVEWSKRIRNITDFKMNMYSSVKLLKSKDR